MVSTIDEYIQGCPEGVRGALSALRSTIRKAAPGASEMISYRIPTFRDNRILVHFAAFKGHIGFYPGPTGIAAFKKELQKYEGAKGSVQFPLGQPIPLSLIAKIVKFRVAENKRAKPKSKKSAPDKSPVKKSGLKTSPA